MDKAIFIAGTLLLTAYGQILVKWRAGVLNREGGDRLEYLRAMFLDPWVWTGLAAAVLASACWILTLQRMSVTLAYPFMALSFVIVPLAATIFLREPFALIQWVGSALIVAGVALVAFGPAR